MLAGHRLSNGGTRAVSGFEVEVRQWGSAAKAAGSAAAQARTVRPGVAWWASALRNASDDVSALKTRVANNDSLADTYQFRIAADGAIVDEKPADPPPRSRFEAEELAEARRHREAIRQQLERETKAILTAANSVDATLARVVRLAQDRQISDGGATTLAGAKKAGEIDAGVVEMEQSLRDAGLLTGPPASGHYRQWLENAVRRACRSRRSSRSPTSTTSRRRTSRSSTGWRRSARTRTATGPSSRTS